MDELGHCSPTFEPRTLSGGCTIPTTPTSGTKAGLTQKAQTVNGSVFGSQIDFTFAGLYTENCLAKIWDVASRYLSNLPNEYPEWVPTQGENKGHYITREARFWTCGFFPGSLYALLERATKFPRSLSIAAEMDSACIHDQLFSLCRHWSGPIREMVTRTDTHDMGFIVMPSLRMDWELTGNKASLEAITTAANSLASRFDPRVGAVRSWDRMQSHRYHVEDKDENFLVIIDSMCNMDLLFYAGYHAKDQKLIDIATAHAHTVLRTIVRPDFSTFHVCNLDPKSGKVKYQQTHQGYADNSTWSRGQAWAILGYTKTYMWTRDPIFLHAAICLSDHFLLRLSQSPHEHPYIPLWDFDAPSDGATTPPRDTSAAMIAANGFLLLHQVLGRDSAYLEAALRIAEAVAAHSLSSQTASLHMDKNGKIVARGNGFDSILMNATANKNGSALKSYSDHGLVYADYYFLEFGNELMRMKIL